MRHVALVDRVIAASDVIARVENHASGAVSIFLGTVRNSNGGNAVTGIEYSAFAEMAERELRAIATEAAESFGTERIAIEHRIGVLEVGEISVAVAASHARRRQAQDSVAFMVEELKRRVPIWKLEHYADGRREWVGAGEIAAAAAV